LDAVVPGWIEIGALVKHGEGRDAYRPPKKLAGSKVRMYIFAPGTVVTEETEEPTPQSPATSKAEVDLWAGLDYE
jgi:hypothetical protein